MAKFSIRMQRIASLSLPVGSITAAAASPRRGKIYDILVGSEATPADNVFVWQLQRCTTAGTATAVTPQSLDPSDSLAATLVGAENHTVVPTLTASAILLQMPLNQRASFRWVAAPGGELVIPATASAGIAFSTPTASALLAVTATAHVDEQ